MTFNASDLGMWENVLGGPWDLVTTYNWASSPTYNWGNPYKAIEGLAFGDLKAKRAYH